MAFPVMTLLLGIQPTVARDFSLMIQSCGIIFFIIFISNAFPNLGMTSAAFTIAYMRIIVEWNAVLLSSLGALFGIVFGLELIDPLLGGRSKAYCRSNLP